MKWLVAGIPKYLQDGNIDGVIRGLKCLSLPSISKKEELELNQSLMADDTINCAYVIKPPLNPKWLSSEGYQVV